MSTPVFNNGIFLRDTSYQVGSHLDSYHLMNMLKDTDPMDLGPVDIWAMQQKVEMPLYQMSSFKGENVIPVKDPRGEYKWQTPISQDVPYVIEDIEPNNVTKGIDGTTFKIKINVRAFGHTDIITYDKYTGAELYIVPTDDILPMGDGFIYTVRLVNNDNFKFLDNKFLANGTKYYRVGSVRGEYGERFSDISVKTGFREFYNYVGGASANVHYSISSKADLMLKGGLNKDGTLPVTEIWRSFDKNLDPAIPVLEQVKAKGESYVKKALANGDLRRSFITNLESAHLTKIAKDIESYLMWGKGGIVAQDGPDHARLSVGLWKQLDSSFKRVYNKSNFSLEIFRSELYNFFAGRVEFQGPDPKRTIIVQTGMGGMRMVSEAIAQQASASGLVIQAAQNAGIGAITGTNAMNLHFGFAYTSYTIPFLANVQWVLNPAFDNVNNNEVENPMIDGFPLSSYSFVIFDVTDNTNDNIYMLKWEENCKLRWWYQNGTIDYMGREGGFQSSGNFSGYRVFMEQGYPALWVKDPTKILKIVMKNPLTGGSL